jgi:integrating conjugative element protein (TIGR03761 family)
LNAARRDDPYADWWLIKVHEAIEANETFIRQRQVELDKHLEQMTGMEVNVAASQHPCRVPLQFANPYAYRAAQLVASYDRLVCTALTARHIGLLDGAATAQVQQACARKLRALFMIPQGYRMLKIDRTWCKRQTAIGASMGGARRYPER